MTMNNPPLPGGIVRRWSPFSVTWVRRKRHGALTDPPHSPRFTSMRASL